MFFIAISVPDFAGVMFILENVLIFKAIFPHGSLLSRVNFARSSVKSLSFKTTSNRKSDPKKSPQISFF
ncbi:MAG: hypothetical protein L0L56_05210, partial [Lacticaseibacillus paracasei]|nr:hypothetical protein [Lacticaseibacillus paracasei]